MLKLKNKNILKTKYIHELRSQLQQEYLVKPFFDNLDNSKIKIIEAPTGVGKTWVIFNEISPFFLENRGNIHIHVAPHTETINEKEIEEYISVSFKQKEFTPKVIYNGAVIDWTGIREALINGRKIIMILSDTKLRNLMEKDNSDIENIVRQYASQVLLTRDEMSWGTTSCPVNYKDNMGHSNNNYQAIYIQNLIKLHGLGANLYGFTATSTREQRGELKTNSEIEIINQWPEKNELVFLQKWIRIMETRKYTTDHYQDESILIKEIKWLSDTIEGRERGIQGILENTKVVDDEKFTGIIQVQTNTSSEDKGKKRYTLSLLLETLKKHPYLVNPEYTLVVANQHGWAEYDYKGDETGEKGKGEGWLTIMNSNCSKARIVVVIEKGNYGINIPSLCAGVSLRNKDPKTRDTGELILMSGKQFCGRMNRSNMNNNAWKNFRILYNEYDIERAFLYLMGKNTFDFYAPTDENGYWEEVVREFKAKYCNTFGEAFSHIFELGD